ncbi:alpha/beta hydrolase [Leptothermofonsia sichuanensis E412]|uniref:alpha/beta fold hydrolase n=1 Tax=Leptothermofonsia sichuanensis TaxID=2917832 RepID=UPI001CA675E7|nr:alpha/beta hydrolase [Leptothermofonsia sichuanensis]QZZ20130.1 alpha/beta hydrolase [Leptothermofonsia sichuanensis E412]
MPTIDILGVPHVYDLTEPTSSTDVLVFVHGWLLSRCYWQPLIERLSGDYQCLAYDLRGFGGSQLVSTPESAHSACQHYSLSAYAADLVLMLKQLGIRQAWLIGHSLGGSIALWAADQSPEMVKGVICLNAGGGIYLKEEFERFRAAGQQLVRWRPRWLPYVPLLDLLFTRVSVARAIARRWGRQRLIDFVTAHPEAALGALLDSTTEVEVHRLPQIVVRLQQPVYFIAGANDPIMEPRYVRHLASFHSLFQEHGANVVEIPNCGHMAMVEQPDLVTEKIRVILAGQGCDEAIAE